MLRKSLAVLYTALALGANPGWADVSGLLTGDMAKLVLSEPAPLPQAALIDQPWCDLATLLGPVDRNAVAATVLDRLVPALDQFDAEGLAPFLSRYAALDALARAPMPPKVTVDAAVRVDTEIKWNAVPGAALYEVVTRATDAPAWGKDSALVTIDGPQAANDANTERRVRSGLSVMTPMVAAPAVDPLIWIAVSSRSPGQANPGHGPAGPGHELSASAWVPWSKICPSYLIFVSS